jgi:hypothetical protein
MHFRIFHVPIGVRQITEVNVTHIHRRAVLPVAALCAALAFAATPSGSAYADNDKKDDIDRSVVQQGFDASPIPKAKLNLKGRDPAQVGLGSYLVNGSGDCNGCHTFPRFLRPGGTAPGTNGNFTGNVTAKGSNRNFGNPYLDPPGDGQPLNGQLQANTNVDHFLAGGRCFGFFQSRNISPDDSGKPRGLTEAEFIQVMRQGKDISCDPARPNPPTYGNVVDPVCSIPEAPGAGHSFNAGVLQTMPWPTYHSLTDTDLKAIYAYLSALPQTTACNAAANGCAGFSNDDRLFNTNNPADPRFVISNNNKLAGITVGANKYIYPNTDDCPNNGPPVTDPSKFIGTSPPQ